VIVFNLLSIPVVIVYLIAVALVQWLFPSLEGSGYQDITFAALALLISSFCEVVGLKGRLFWLPIWVTSLVVTVFVAYNDFGWLGLGVGVVGAAVLAFGFFRLGDHMHKKEWEVAPEKLRQAQEAVSQGNAESAWELYAEAFMYNFADGYAPHEARHNAQVLESFLKFADDKVAPQHLSNVEVFRDELKKGASSMKHLNCENSEERVGERPDCESGPGGGT